MEMSSQLHVPAVSPPGKKSPRYPFDRRAGGPQSRSGYGGEEKETHATAENQTPVAQLRQ